MKKILLVILVMFTAFTVGCSNKSSGVENLSKKEYTHKLNSTVDEILSKYGSEYVDIKTDYEDIIEKTPENADYQQLLATYQNNKTKYKEMGEQLSKFRCKDKEINQLHDKLIKTCFDISNYYKELDELEEKIKDVGVKEWVNELEIEAGTVPENLISEKEYNEIHSRIQSLGEMVDRVTLEDIWSELELALGQSLD